MFCRTAWRPATAKASGWLMGWASGDGGILAGWGFWGYSTNVLVGWCFVGLARLWLWRLADFLVAGWRRFRPSRASYFSLLVQREVTKRKHAPTSESDRLEAIRLPSLRCRSERRWSEGTRRSAPGRIEGQALLVIFAGAGHPATGKSNSPRRAKPSIFKQLGKQPGRGHPGRMRRAVVMPSFPALGIRRIKKPPRRAAFFTSASLTSIRDRSWP